MPPSPCVATLSELHADHVKRVNVGETPVLLLQIDGVVHAYGANCPHAGAPLDEGALCDGRIVCPWHKATFDAATGALLEPPALEGLVRYRTRVTGDNVHVDPHAAQPGTPPPPPAASSVSHARVLIAGAGASGAAACAALREFGFAGPVVLVGDETGVPYDRTSLSKFVPAGDMAPDDVPPLLPGNFFESQQIERVTGLIERLDIAAHTAVLAGGRSLSYDTVILASGAGPVVPPMPGNTLAGTFALRTRGDARRLVEGMPDHSRVVVVGSSFIGLEVASALRKREIAVTVVSPDAVPFAKQFGERFGRYFQALHETNGVTFRLGEKVRSIQRSGSVNAVELESGEQIGTDAVLFATGVKPATSFVAGLELDDDGAIPVDASMRAAPDVYAVGDIASFPCGFPYGAASETTQRIRIEHWRVAQQHARIAAQNICGGTAQYAGVPFFWTYHYGKRYDFLGVAGNWDEQIVEGDPDHHSFAVLYVAHGQLTALLACDYVAAVSRLAEAMRGRVTSAQALQILRGG